MDYIAIAIFIIIAGLTIHVWYSNEQDQKRPSTTGARIFINGVELTAATLRVDSTTTLNYENTGALFVDNAPQDDIFKWAWEPVACKQRQ